MRAVLTIVSVGGRGDEEEEDPGVESDQTPVLVPSTVMKELIDLGIAASVCDETASHLTSCLVGKMKKSEEWEGRRRGPGG